MQGGIFSYALLAALATGLLVAAFTDLRRRQIDNWLTGLIALAAPLFWFASGLSFTQIGYQLGLAAIVFAVTAALFALRQMGGGDVKLLSALALWVPPLAFLKLIVMMGLIGGAASIAGAAFNLQRREGENVRDLLGIGAAFIWVALSGWVIFAMLIGRPPVSADQTAAFASFFSAPWMIAAALGLIAVILFFGIAHVVRRQKSRLRIPYGVAISIAGLWILANYHLPALRAEVIAG